jgi:MFS family permease
MGESTTEPVAASPAGAPRIPAKIWKVGTLTYTTAGLVALFCWLLFGDFAWQMRGRSVFPMVKWYLKSMEVPNLLFGLLITSFPAVLSLLLVPVISVKSDRHRGHWGRRIPFLLVTAPLAGFGMVGIAFTPFLARWVHGFFPNAGETLVAVLCFGVFWAAFELASIAGEAVLNGLINDVVPKAVIGRFYGMFRAISLIDGIIFNYWIMGYVPTHFTLILATIGTVYCVAFMCMCLRVKEGQYPPVAAAPAAGGGVLARRFGSVRQYMRECFSNPYYLSVFAMLTLASLAFAPFNTFAIPYAQSLNLGMDVYGKCLALIFAISLVLSYFIGWCSDIFHPIRVAMVALAGYMGISIWASQCANTPLTFSIAFVLHGTVSGAYVTSAASIGQRLYPQTKFAQFASAAGVFLSICSIGLGPMVGLAIDLSGNAYRHTFAIGAVFSFAALVAGVWVYRRFIRIGGPKNYVPPE